MTALLVDFETKVCNACLTTKPLMEFYRRGGGKRGAQCKTCRNTRQRAYYALDPARYSAYNRKQHYSALGMTDVQFQAMVVEQNGLCALCKKPPEGKRNSAVLHFDHNHKTGVARRPLCSHCNRGLGCFGDDPELLRLAADYIEAHQ
jgi:Recombination endonuclease VII